MQKTTNKIGAVNTPNRLFWRFLIVLFVFQAFSDVTFLQYYKGNEVLGIPPAHHLKSIKPVKTNEFKYQALSCNHSQHSGQSEHSESPHSHLTFGSVFIKSEVEIAFNLSAISLVESEKSVFVNVENYSYLTLPPPFLPPRNI